MKKAFLLLLVVIAFSLAQGQGRLDVVFDKKDLVEDLNDLKSTILKSHPDPFVFCTEKEFLNMHLASTIAVDNEMNLRDFSFIVANFLQILKDSHTALDYNQLQQLQMDGGGYYLPLTLERIESLDSVSKFDIVIRNYWGNENLKGAKVLAINGISIDSLYSVASTYACIEGDAESAHNSVATAILTTVAGLLKPYQKTNTLRIIPFESDVPKDLVVRAYNSKEFAKKRSERAKLDQNKVLDLNFDEEHNLAILQVGTFSPSSGRAFRKFIKESIEEVIDSGYKHLAIDIRGNGGGSSAWVEYLYSFIDTLGYNTPSNVIAKNSEIALSRARMYHSALGKIFTFLFYRNNEDVQSFRQFASLELGEMDTIYFHKPTKQTKEIVFTGDCFLLINGLTASAGVDFTNAFRSRERGEIIGEQCLGPVNGTWGNPAGYTLSRTGLRLSIATIRYNYDNTFEYSMNGINPDYMVDCTRQDIFHEVDTQVEFVKKLIDEKK